MFVIIKTKLSFGKEDIAGLCTFVRLSKHRSSIFTYENSEARSVFADYGVNQLVL